MKFSMKRICPNILNIFLNLEETYTCEKCNNEFRVDISLTPTLLTQPVYTEQDILLAGSSEQDQESKEPSDVQFTSEYTKGTEL